VGPPGPRRLHGPAAEPDVEEGLAGAADEPQRPQDAGAARVGRLVVGRAVAGPAAVALHGRSTAEVAGADAARGVDRRPQQPGDLLLGQRSGDVQAQALSVRGGVRLHAARDELVLRPAAARRDRPGVVRALPRRRHEVRRVVLGAPGRGAAPAGRRLPVRHQGPHRRRHRALAPARPARALQRGAEPRRRARRAAQTAQYDVSLDASTPHTSAEIWDRACRAATLALSKGREERDLAWFSEHGVYLVPFSRLNWYLHPEMLRKGLRYELPYQERLKRIGA